MKAIKFLAVALLAIVMASCGGGYSEEKAKEYTKQLEESVEQGKALDNYAEIIEFCEASSIEALEETAPLQKEAKEAKESGDMEKAAELMKKAEEIGKKYSAMEDLDLAMDASMSLMSDEDKKLFEEAEKRIAEKAKELEK